MTEHKIQPRTRHENKCLEFEVADGKTAEEILENHEDQCGNNGDGVWIGKYRNREDTILVEGYPYTSFTPMSDGRIRVSDEGGSMTFDADELSHAREMHGLS